MQRQQGTLRPETTLKQAEELEAVGQHTSALECLHEVIVSKRYRNYQLGLEAVMLKYVELCVQLGKEALVRDGLAQYKNTVQYANIQSLEIVIAAFLNAAEAKVTLAQEKAQKIAVEQIEDLEENETPEAILMRTLMDESGPSSSSSPSFTAASSSAARTDHEVVKPALRFLWEAYRIVLDILRNNNRVEILYKTTMIRAQDFCLKYKRKVEFRRLCDIARSHLGTVLRYSQLPNAINLNEPESLQLQLDIRFAQLNIASELELWQDGFRSIEDIHGLFRIAKKPGSHATMLNYYSKLSKMFWVGGNQLFHAAALGRYFHYLKMNEKKDAAEFAMLAKQYVIAVLSIPVVNSKTSFISELVDTEESRAKEQHLTALLGLSVIPRRESLLQNVLEKDVQVVLDENTKSLFNMLEIQFHPLSITEKIEPLFASIVKDSSTVQYVNALYDLFLIRFIQQICHIHPRISIPEFLKMTRIAAVPEMTPFKMELFILPACKNGAFHIKIDSKRNELIFLDYASATLLDGKVNIHKRTPLSQPEGTFASLCSQFPPEPIPEGVFESLKSLVEEENKNMLNRRRMIEKRKEALESEQAKREAEEARIRAQRAAQEQELEKIRLQEESRRREMERIKREREEIEKGEAKRLAEELKNKLEAVGMKIDIDEFQGLDKKTLLAKQVEHLDKEKKDMEGRMKGVLKKLDHLDRAIRQEENPLLIADFEEAKKHHQQRLLAKFNSDLELKERIASLNFEFEAFKKQVLIKRQKEFEARKEQADALLNAAKQERIAEHRKHAEELAAIRRGQEEAQARQQIEEDKQKVDRTKATEQATERQAKLDVMAARQKETERRIEEKMKRVSVTSSAAKPVESAGSSKYVPPSKRGDTKASSGSSSGINKRPGHSDSNDSWR